MSIFSQIQDVDSSKFDGEYFGSFMCKYYPKAVVSVTVSNTINKNMKLVNIYIDDNRVTGVRYYKDRIGIFEINVLLDRIYWDYFA